jgi:hypothetical protein
MGKVKVSAQVNQEAVSEGELMFYLAEAAGA